MRTILLVGAFLLAVAVTIVSAEFRAGAAKVDATLPVGVPLAGYDHGSRKVPKWPIPEFREYSTFLMPSQGVLDPTWVKALVVDDVGGGGRVCFVTLDLMCADSSIQFLAHALARGDGFTIPLERVGFSGSHTHSGPGAWVSELGIQITPTMDFLVPKVQRMLAASIARAMVEAERNLKPAAIGLGMGEILGMTQNRRSGISPYVRHDTIDPHVGVMRVDDARSGEPIATLWNFAIHGTCQGPDNMLFSSDIMGNVCDKLEQRVGGIAMFVNADAGDISPSGLACEGKPDYNGGTNMSAIIAATRANLETVTDGTLKHSAQDVDFGFTESNFTLARIANCTTGGPFDICGICEVLHCDLNLKAGSFLVEEVPRFSAVSWNLGGNTTVMVSVPGEALVELGWQIRNDSLKTFGFQNTFLFGYTNNYLMYFATPNEYDIGGYESILTLWGINTTAKVRAGAYGVMQNVATAAVSNPSLMTDVGFDVLDESVLP